MKNFYLSATCLVLFVVLSGCSQETTQNASAPAVTLPTVTDIDGSVFILASEPEGAGDVIKVRSEAANDDEVLIVGRIGGSSDPWIEGRAAFTIVDQSLKACTDIPGDNCPIPWDYCCETSKLPTSMALVKFVDDSGAVVKADAKGLLGVKELSTIIVKGKAKRDEAGNLTILASGVFVKQK
ncbi:MAG: hypothetical protein OSA98_07915 [Rubripirellula sp.]|nr:hypothetical protein [Rubripirellula sp.]